MRGWRFQFNDKQTQVSKARPMQNNNPFMEINILPLSFTLTQKDNVSKQYHTNDASLQ
jgi:hypothetical protein